MDDMYSTKAAEVELQVGIENTQLADSPISLIAPFARFARLVSRFVAQTVYRVFTSNLSLPQRKGRSPRGKYRDYFVPPITVLLSAISTSINPPTYIPVSYTHL